MKFLSIIIIIFVFISAVSGGTLSDNPKFTPAVKKLIDNNNLKQKNNYWLFLDDTAFDRLEISLSERSLNRRSRVDPANYLIDEHDYKLNDAVLSALAVKNIEVRHVISWFHAVTIRADAYALNEVAKLSTVKRIDPVKRYYAEKHQFEIIENNKEKHLRGLIDYDYGPSVNQAHFINAIKLHQSNITGAGVMIAMLDTGFDTTHAAFDQANISAVYNFIDGNDTVHTMDCPNDVTRNHQSFHGTLTLGVLAGDASGTLVGIARDAEYILAKTEISCGNTEIQIEEDNWIAAAQWADSVGADIINSSLGYAGFQDAAGYTFDDLDGDTPMITQAADIAAEKNILVVTSAGNERNSSWGHILTPADGDSVIAVGAVNLDSTLASFSSPGPSADGRIKPDIATLGTSIVSSSHLGGYNLSASGTSFSAPLVSGGAALALSHDLTMTADELRQLIKSSGDRQDFPDNNFGYGLFDAVKTADIIKFELPLGMNVNVNQTDSMLVLTSGRSAVVPLIYGVNLPPSISVIDNNDGTAWLKVTAASIAEPLLKLNLAADVGYFADTTEFKITFNIGEEILFQVGPNPCHDSLNIFVFPAENVRGLAIYNMSGEIIWEKANDFNINADIERVEENWNGHNRRGEKVAAGVYVVQVITDQSQYMKKILLIK